MVYVRDNIPSNLVKLDQNFDNFEGFFIELELSKKNKWLLSYSYNPHEGNIKQHLSNISKGLDELNSKYDNILIIGDLNSEMSEPSLDEFCQMYNLVSIVNKPTFFKNPKNPSCIDLMLTNKQERFLKANTIEIPLGTNRVILRDGSKVMSGIERVADTFNKFFVNIGNTLKIDKDKQFLVETNDVFDPVLKAIKKYSAHPSVLSIKEKMNNNVFSFREVTYEEILNEINSLDTSKSTQSEDIPFKIINDNADIFANFILQSFNKYIIDGKFPDQLKIADVSPIFKKGNYNDKTNYRPVSILPSLSKVYERLIYNQIN